MKCRIFGVSSATIRNEMQDLGDEGYLEQPHTSAGRIPSVKGYRFYVDRLMEPGRVTDEEKEAITKLIAEHAAKTDEIFRSLARLVSSLTHTLSVAADAHAFCGGAEGGGDVHIQLHPLSSPRRPPGDPARGDAGSRIRRWMSSSSSRTG